MNQYQVEIYVPLIKKTYDMYISVNSQIYNIVKTIAQYLDTTQDIFQFSLMECALCNRENGVVYNSCMTAYEAGIQNGTKLILM